MKKVGRILILLVLFSMSFGMFGLAVRAEENAEDVTVTELNQIMTILVDCDAKEFPKRGAEGVISYSAGSPVWVIGETEDGWYLVSYQDQKGYIPKDYIDILTVETEDKGAVGLAEAGLDKEMEALEAESKMVIDEVERQRGESKRSHIWIVVIVLLVIGIFATGIISTIKFGKAVKDKKNDNTEVIGRKKANSIEVIDLDLEEEENHETDYSDSVL